MDITRSAKRLTSARSWSNPGDESVVKLATGGAETSTMRSASWAKSSRVMSSGLDARTMRTFPGRRCKNNSRTKALSVAAVSSPNSCSMRRSKCEGFRSPSSSEVRSCWSRRCRTSYGHGRAGVKHLRGVFRRERSDCVVEFRLLYCDTPRGELGLYLCKPDFRVCRPKQGQLQVDRGHCARCRIESHHGGTRAKVESVDVRVDSINLY